MQQRTAFCSKGEWEYGNLTSLARGEGVVYTRLARDKSFDTTLTHLDKENNLQVSHNGGG